MKNKTFVLFELVLILFFSIPAHAAEYEERFVINKEINRCMFQIYWENKDETANVVLISPEGTVFDKSNKNYHSTEGLVWITVDVASPGEWVIKVDGNNLGSINYQAGSIPEYVRIADFNVTQVNSNEFDISWNVVNSYGTLNFFVYADRNNSGYGGIKVEQFLGESSGTRRIKIDNIDTGEYFLYIKVMDSMEIPDSRYSESYFKIVNPDAPQKLSNLVYGVFNDGVYAKWDALLDNAEYKFMLFKKGVAMPFFETVTADNWFVYPALVDAQNIELAVAGIKNGKVGDYERFNVNKDINLKYKIEFPQNDVINSKSIRLFADFEKPILMSIYINDKMVIEKTNKAGDYRIDLTEGENTVGVVMVDDRGNIKSEEKSFYVDTYPPQLNILTDLDGKRVTTPSVFITGKTEPSAALSINNDSVTVDNNGSYSYKAKLLPGSNTIAITAKDIAGNESKIILKVEFDFFGSPIFYIIAGLAIFIGLAIYYLIVFIRIKREIKLKNNSDIKAKKSENDEAEGDNTDEKAD